MIIRRFREWLRGKSPAAAPATEPVSRADKYDSSILQGLLAKQQEAERAQVEAFQASVVDACSKIKVWRPNASGAMDAADPLGSLSSAMDSSTSGLPSFKEIAISAGSQLALMPW
jgi:hypothetical protein